MQKVGIERRLVTAGEYKGFLDPFLPVNVTQQTHIRHMLKTVHRQFIQAVKQGRGKRLKSDPKLIFRFSVDWDWR